MSEELERIKQRMEDTGKTTLAQFERLEPDGWLQRVYTTGSCWSVRHVLAHFISSERGFASVVQNIAAGGSGVPKDFDIDEFNEREVAEFEDQTPQQLMDDFRRARAASVSLVETLAPGDLERTGHHPYFGETQIRDMLKLIYRHNMIHMRDLRKALETQQPLPHKQTDPPGSSA